MTGHEHRVGAGDALGDRTRLLRIAVVVADVEHELLAEHAAGRVDVGDRLLGALLHLLAERGVVAGHRAGDGDADVRRSRAGQRERTAAPANSTVFMMSPSYF